MCGIAGFAYPGMSDKHLHIMLDSMRTRGPDGVGEFHMGTLHMGMRRLSIIDLAHGWQPLYARGRSVVAFQNGEIYNYKALRKELEGSGYAFVTNSDTEVLAHGYVAWGWLELLKKIDGMYAIVIADLQKNCLFLARDRFGEKPLFFSHSERGFAYASNLLSMSAMPWVSDEWDPSALDYYLALHFVPGPRTVFRDVRQLLPGEALELNLSNLTFHTIQYYVPHPSESGPGSDADLRQTLETAVTSRLVADVPVGVFLSGGLDSSLVAAIAAAASPGIKTFSIGFGGTDSDEGPFAEKLARHIGSDHRTLQFGVDSFRELLPQVADALDTPIGDQALLPVFWLAREASREVKVVLAGEGADEMFAGYSYYRQFLKMDLRNYLCKLRQLLRYHKPSEPVNSCLINESVSRLLSGFPILMSVSDRRKILQGLINGGANTSFNDGWAQEIKVDIESYGNALLRATLYDIRTWLADDLLVKFDRMAMAHSIEGRAPFLYPALAEKGLALREKDRMSNGISKVALRRVASNYIPPDLAERPKKGFVLPMARWLETWLLDQGGAEQYFCQKNIDGLNSDCIARMVREDLFDGVKRERMLFALVMLVEWWSAFSQKRHALREALMAAT